jgi:hypothetical protein
MSFPSIAGNLVATAQEVRLSDVATWMSRRHDSNFSKRAGKGTIPGSPFFGLLFFGETKKSDSPKGAKKNTRNLKKKMANNPETYLPVYKLPQ